MKKTLMLLAASVSAVAIVAAVDPGRFAFDDVDAGGHQLRMQIAGHGGPVVVFEAGGLAASGGVLESWERVEPAVSRFTTTVAYDRAGIGRSAPGPKPRDARQVARELHTALHNAHVPPPYILVGHSFGGPLIRVFASMYPDEIAGLVLLDPAQEEFLDWNLARNPSGGIRDPEERTETLASLAEAHESSVPAGVPVVLITAMGPRVLPEFISEKDKQELKTIRPMWLKFHQEWINKIPGGQHIITENSGHGIPFDEPELVVRTIRQEVDKARSGHSRNSTPGDSR